MEKILKYSLLNKQRKNEKDKEIYKRIITVAIINKMLISISKDLEFVHHISYEELCKDPNGVFNNLANFFSLEFNRNTLKFIDESQRKKSEKYNPYSIYRDTAEQINRPFRVISKVQAERALKMLSDCNLL